MAALAQTIAVVDRSGKVISTNKHWKNVFKEAKLAYQERKAEIVAEKRAKEDRELQKALRSMSLGEDWKPPHTRQQLDRQTSQTYSRGITSPRDQGHNKPRPDAVHRQSSSRSVQSHNSSTVSNSPPQQTLGQFNEELYGVTRSATSPNLNGRPNDLMRRQTDKFALADATRRTPTRSQSTTDLDGHVDMDLAYGDYPFDHLEVAPRMNEQTKKDEMSSLVLKCKMLMDEANCAQHSVKAIVAHLQKNPEAMAAIGLTLAEISNLARKMPPGTLTVFKAGAPTIFAILAAPEFLIAVGVGVGLTIVAFGGYKIIKKIKEKARGDKDDGMDEMLDVADLDRIQNWRRGLPDTDTASVVTSVDGELITPLAAASMGHLPSTANRTRSGEDRRKDGAKGERRKKHKHRGDGSRSEAGSERSSHSRRRSNADSSDAQGSRDNALVKVKKPSPLQRMFHSGSSVASSDRR